MTPWCLDATNQSWNWSYSDLVTRLGFISSNTIANQSKTFAKSDAKLYVVVVTLSTDDNAKLPQQLKQQFKPTIIWNKV